MSVERLVCFKPFVKVGVLKVKLVVVGSRKRVELTSLQAINFSIFRRIESCKV